MNIFVSPLPDLKAIFSPFFFNLKAIVSYNCYTYISIIYYVTCNSIPQVAGVFNKYLPVNSVQLISTPNLNLEVALVWAVNAKNSLSMVYGWSPYQLVFGSNLNMPKVINDKPPALENTTVSKNFAKHLNALHSSRGAFIQAESSERVRRALRHKIRASGECYQQGDHVYFKRNDENQWKGPGTVIGQDGKIVFVRHGSIYVCVPPCRLIRCGTEFSVEGNKGTSNKEQNESDRLSKTSLVANESDSESENETEKEHEPLNLEEEPEIDPVPILPEVQIQQNAEIVRPKE